MYFPKEGHITNHSKAESTIRPAASLRLYSTTQFVVVSLCRVSLHDNMEFNAAFVFFKSFSAKHGKKGKEKRNDYSVIEQNALSGNYMENILKGSHPKMTGKMRV